MGKSILDRLFLAIEDADLHNVNKYYNEYKEESKTVPRYKQEVFVWNEEGDVPGIAFFIGFASNGKTVVETLKGFVDVYNHCRLPKPKVKYKVVRNEDGTFSTLTENTITPLRVVSTFED